MAKIFLFFCLAFIFGIAAASFIDFPLVVHYLIFLLGLLLIVFGLIQDKRIWFIGLLILFFLLGIVRYELSFPPVNENYPQFYHQKKIIFQGIVKKVEQRLEKKELVIKVRQLIFSEETKKVSGQVLVFTPLYADYQYGDLVEISCQLKKPQPIEKFVYHEYLASENIYSICWPKEIKILAREQGNFLYAQILRIKEKVKLAIDQNFSEPQGAILSAFLLGIKKEILPEVREWFSRTGTAHLLAISGLHLTIFVNLLVLAGIVVFSLRRQDTFYFILLVLVFFIILIGAPASAVRAGLMGLTGLWAEKLGRRRYVLNFLLLAATIMLLINPKLLKADPGFQLSFSAMLGIIFLSPYFFEKFKKVPEKFQLRLSLSMTLGAYLFTLPLIFYYFGYFSLSALLANLLVLPLLPILMGLAFLFALGSLIYLPLGEVLFFPVWLGLTYLMNVVKNLAAIPFLSFNLGPVPWFVVLFLYVLLFYFLSKIKPVRQIFVFKK